LIRCQLLKALHASVIAAALLAPFISVAFADDPIRPDPKLTPGDTLPVTTDEIASPVTLSSFGDTSTAGQKPKCTGSTTSKIISRERMRSTI
jgi:hypothetical protein